MLIFLALSCRCFIFLALSCRCFIFPPQKQGAESVPSKLHVLHAWHLL